MNKPRIFFKALPIALIVLFILFFSGILKASEKTAEISLPTIQCGMCVRTIEKALDKLGGVINIDIDVENKKALVTFDDTKTDLLKIEDAITKAGYSVNEKKADEAAYKKLHSCCKLPEDR